jgi:RNA polymerase sigma-70 factor (ECF subfamily)
LLDLLPVEERTVWVLRQVEGMDLQEIAEAVGVSLATVKRRLRRALDRLELRIRKDTALSAYLPKVKTHEA